MTGRSSDLPGRHAGSSRNVGHMQNDTSRWDRVRFVQKTRPRSNLWMDTILGKNVMKSRIVKITKWCGLCSGVKIYSMHNLTDLFLTSIYHVVVRTLRWDAQMWVENWAVHCSLLLETNRCPLFRHLSTFVASSFLSRVALSRSLSFIYLCAPIFVRCCFVTPFRPNDESKGLNSTLQIWTLHPFILIERN